jgi:uracil-DNA glycosylase family 4
MYEVSGNGRTSDLMVVADYPSREELINKMSISGKVGNSVEYLLKQQGIQKFNTYCTHVVKIGRDEFYKKDKRRVMTALQSAMHEYPFLDTLKNEIKAIAPNSIIALGEHSLNVLTGLKGIDNYRGSILPISPLLGLAAKIKVIPTLHPRSMWQQMSMQPIVAFDYERAVAKSRDNQPPKQDYLIWYAKTIAGLNDYWNRACKGEFMVFDIETFRGYITCIGFCTDGREAVSVPLWDYTTVAERALIWKLVDKMLSSEMPKINQNVAFDIHHEERWGFTVKNVVGDTSILMRCVYPEFKTRLALMQSLYTEIPYHKDEAHEYNPTIGKAGQLYEYNAKDCVATWRSWKGLVTDAKEFKVWDFHQRTYWDNGLFHIYRKMDGRGIRVDFEKRNKLIDSYTARLNSHHQSVEALYGRSLNIRSPKQVIEFVYGYLECPKIWKRANDDGVSTLDTGKEALEELYVNKVKNQATKRALREIIIVRKLEKILEYLQYLVHPDGRMRTSTKLPGTKNGRTSQSTHYDSLHYYPEEGKALKWVNFGGSLQVIPKRGFECEEFEGQIFGADVSEMYVPSPGYSFVEGDGSNAEGRVVCVLANDFETLELMKKTDLHRLTASWCLEKAYELITELERELTGKRPRHAGNYDMTEYRLSSMIQRTVEFCRKLLINFHNRVPNVRGVFHEGVRQTIQRNLPLISPQGRRRQFFGHQNPAFFKEAFSMIPQATVADHVKCTMPYVINDVPSVEFLEEKHDSLLMEVPTIEKEYLFDNFKKHMERPISFREGTFQRDYDLIIPCEIKCSEESWGHMKKVKMK